MKYCASVRKMGSTDQCTARPIKGHVFCGRHIRARYVVLWASTQQAKANLLIPCQALIRGWLVRKRLQMAGPGALSRKNLVNEDDLVTCESKDKQHPFEYFSFEESDKIWWFDWDTMWKWSVRSVTPLNPYTKVPLSMEARKRLREGFGYRGRHLIPMPQNCLPSSPIGIQYRWNLLLQIFDENGFGIIPASTFLNMRKIHFLTMLNLLQDDIEVIYRDTYYLKREFIRGCSKLRGLVLKLRTEDYTIECLDFLVTILVLVKDPYVLAFSILSALYRC